MGDIYGALIAAFVALFTAYLTLFLGERYKRFHEGSALAAGFAGELGSYTEGYPLMQRVLAEMTRCAEQGTHRELSLRPFEKPLDRFFEASVSKVGLLGPELAERVIYIYSNLNAFRMTLILISEKHSEMSDVEFHSRVTVCVQLADKANAAMTEVVPKLHSRSKACFCPLIS